MMHKMKQAAEIIEVLMGVAMVILMAVMAVPATSWFK